MTSLLPSSAPSHTRPGAEVGRDLANRRPLALIAGLAGLAAAVAPLTVCLSVGVVGWFLTDAGAHGAPRDALRVGAQGWLVAHGSGLQVQGIALTLVPLGITALCAWTIWRIGHRVGDSVSGHGPDLDRLADGERDWTVPASVAVFVAAYLTCVVVTARVVGADASVTGLVAWSLVLCLGVGAPAVAIGSGRAAIWAAVLPPTLRAAGHAARRILVLWLAVSFTAFAVALILDFSTAANVMSQLHTDPGDTALMTLLSLAVVPNAVVFSGSYLLGPGFTVGVGTLVTPNAVLLGPLPMFPLLAALPDDGPVPGWTAGLVSLPVLVGMVGALVAQRRRPTLRWEEGAVRGCAGGVLAGLVFGLLAAVAGGAVGPGRMSEVGPLAFDVLVHAITAFGIGGLVGGLVTTWWQRRTHARTAAASS